MKCFAPVHLPIPPYLLRLISINLLATPTHPHRLPLCIVFGLSFFLSSFLSSFLSISVILLGKVIKGQHIEGATLHRVILFSSAPFLSPIFVLQQKTLSEEGRRKPDKASEVLCGVIIWQPDNARRVSRFLPRFSSSLFPSFCSLQEVPLRLRVIQWGYTPGKMSEPPPPVPCPQPALFDARRQTCIGQRVKVVYLWTEPPAVCSFPSITAAAMSVLQIFIMNKGRCKLHWRPK